MGYIVKRFQPGDGSTSRHARVHFARRLLKASAGAVDYQRLDLRILQRNAAAVDLQCAPVDAHEARSWVVNPLPRMGRSTARKDRMPGVRAKLDDKPAPHKARWECINSHESRLTHSRVPRWKYDIRTCDNRSSPAPKALFGRRARLAEPRSFPWSRVRKLTTSASFKG